MWERVPPPRKAEAAFLLAQAFLRGAVMRGILFDQQKAAAALPRRNAGRARPGKGVEYEIAAPRERLY
jgi:hypothetical protein